MKIKRFENVWIMGLILSGAILLFLYILKLIFPSFVIETAQNEQICKIGRYIDTHKWAWYLASSILSFTLYYLSCCSKIAEADKINELILCIDKELKYSTRKMLDYKGVNYDAYYVMYDQKELHEEYETRLKDGFKIEMC